MYLYILRSKVRRWNYVGITKDLEGRIKGHNSGREKSTKPYKPFELLFIQEVDSYKKARLFEKF